MNRMAVLMCLGAITCLSRMTWADVKLPAIFGDHMVLQRGMNVPFWGTADAGEKVTVKVGAQTHSATADDKGKWRIVLDPLDAKQPIEITVSGKNTVTLRDVLVGEVWVCSGQSNMGFGLKHATRGKEAIEAAAGRPTIRLFTVGRQIAPDGPKDDLAESKWEVCSPQSVAEFSAVAYLFGRELQDKLDVPIGLIEPSWGGTRAEAFMPRETFEALNLPYEPEWTQEKLNPKRRPGATTQPQPRPHEGPAVLWNGMIAPLAGYAIRGVVWYQGETNTAHGEYYDRVLSGLITSWRRAWGQGDMPCLVVQLPNVRSTRFWPVTRDAQARAVRSLPNVGMAVTIDGTSNDLHPPDKRPVAHRLALLAQKLAYGMDVPYSGPRFKSMRIHENSARLTFDHVEGGLVAKGDALEGFQIAGADGQFVPARATIDGDTVVVRADGVTSLKTVRYAWENDPKATLYNKADLPAAPFQAAAE